MKLAEITGNPIPSLVSPHENSQIRSVSDASLASRSSMNFSQQSAGARERTCRHISSVESTRTRSRSQSQERMEMEIDNSEDEDGEENRGHGDGFFSMQMNEEDVNGDERAAEYVGTSTSTTTHTIPTTKHVASKAALQRGVQIAQKLANFVDFTPTCDKLKRDCNDFFLVNYRNVKSTSKRGGDRTVHPLEGNKRILTIFCRSRLHFLRMFDATIRATMAAEDPDKNSELCPLHECKYVFGTEEKSLKDSLSLNSNFAF